MPALNSEPPRLLREVGAAGIACVCVDTLFNSFEVLKVRSQLQLTSTPIPQLARELVEVGGVGALALPGLGATWLRGLTYTGFRIGAYPEAKRRLQRVSGLQDSFWLCASAGLLTGSIGAALFTPVDVIRVRLQGDPKAFSHQPALLRTIRAFPMVVARGGWHALYSGWSACVLRAALLSSSQLASYDCAKSSAKRLEIAAEGPAMHTMCSFTSGLIAQTIVQPVDTVRTVMLAGYTGGGGLIACAASILREAGPLGLYRGYLPAILRQGPVIAMQMPLIEELRRLFGLGYM
uniref:Mitochondrial carrier protein n=1 Tax=Calcidiscus leptoporus TaxID=127549 RepID=A0A7S0J389_9EUKA|mmetsp:Transcript_35684/g.83268  ORF Transcript_35684/g.83268 Transcript_35684/m.83268 type:complete len:292 (+) Transcript_35684:68-943(+)